MGVSVYWFFWSFIYVNQRYLVIGATRMPIIGGDRCDPRSQRGIEGDDGRSRPFERRTTRRFRTSLTFGWTLRWHSSWVRIFIQSTISLLPVDFLNIQSIILYSQYSVQQFILSGWFSKINHFMFKYSVYHFIFVLYIFDLQNILLMPAAPE